jgi:hypothetical protein
MGRPHRAPRLSDDRAGQQPGRASDPRAGRDKEERRRLPQRRLGPQRRRDLDRHRDRAAGRPERHHLPVSYVESERGRHCRPKAVLTCEDSRVTRILWTATKEHSTESPPTSTNAAGTRASPWPARPWNASCPGTRTRKTSPPGHNPRHPDKPQPTHTVTGPARDNRHADRRHAISQDFRVLTIRRHCSLTELTHSRTSGGSLELRMYGSSPASWPVRLRPARSGLYSARLRTSE